MFPVVGGGECCHLNVLKYAILKGDLNATELYRCKKICGKNCFHLTCFFKNCFFFTVSPPPPRWQGDIFHMTSYWVTDLLLLLFMLILLLFFCFYCCYFCCSSLYFLLLFLLLWKNNGNYSKTEVTKYSVCFVFFLN